MSGARPVVKPLPANRRKKAATGAAAATGAETADSCDESEESDIQFEDRAKVDMALSSSGSEGSVDTDVESGVEMEPPAAAATGAPGDEFPPLAAAAAGAAGSDDDDTASEDGGNVRVRVAMHPGGHWQIWSSMWFYINQVPGYVDIKVHMKGPLRNIATGMGRDFMTKTMTPHHYGESFERPVRTLLLLRAWAIWRAKLMGWSARAPGRLREVAMQSSSLEADVRALQGTAGRPLLHNKEAEVQLRKWAPAVFHAVAGI